MRVKTFKGKNTSEVLERVKRELGSEAVILSNKTVREHGICFCEVMAAVEQTHEPDDSSLQSQGEFESGPGNWQREWSRIKELLLGFAGDRMDLSLLSPRQRQAVNHLVSEGVEQTVIMRLFSGLRTDPQASVLGLLSEMVGVRPLTQANWKQRMHILCGPSGCGKTSTMIRMALAHKRACPDARICLVNADEGHGKGRLVLKHYADLSGFAFRELYGRDDLQNLLAESHEFDRIFIDLPSLSPGASMQDTLAALGLQSAPDAALHLVLSPHYAQAQLRAFISAYATKKTASLVWTKLDEACTFGNIVNVAEESGLPVSALTFGSGLKDWRPDVEQLALWKLVFKHELPLPARTAKAAA